MSWVTWWLLLLCLQAQPCPGHDCEGGEAEVPWEWNRVLPALF